MSVKRFRFRPKCNRKLFSKRNQWRFKINRLRTIKPSRKTFYFESIGTKYSTVTCPRWN